MYHIKKDQRSILSGNMVYQALAKKMKEKEFRSITIQEVVNEAQVGRSTFYRNFDKLEDVLWWKCDEAFLGLHDYILEAMPAQTNLIGGGKFPFILPFFRYWHADSTIVELLVAANRTDLIFTAFEDTLRKLVLGLHQAMAKLFPHFEYFLAFRSGAVIRILLQWLRKGKDLTPEELSALIAAQSEGFAGGGK
jgi:AcrR family transcriptional regulator